MSCHFHFAEDKATDEMQCALPLPRNAERKRGESHGSHGSSPASWWLDVMLRSAKRRRRPCDTSLADDDLVGLQACSMCWDGMEMLQDGNVEIWRDVGICQDVQVFFQKFWCTFWIDPAISKHVHDVHDIGHSKSLKQRNATGWSVDHDSPPRSKCGNIKIQLGLV